MSIAPLSPSAGSARTRSSLPRRLVLGLAVAVSATVPLTAQTTKDPVILFVPGYTAPTLSAKMKDSYFLDQRAHFANTLRRDVLYLNTPDLIKNGRTDYLAFPFNNFKLGAGVDPRFDSRRTRIDLNADAIALVLNELKKLGRKVTIVSHSKGGQDVLHALLTNKQVWPIVTGWLAFTTNFFESKFKVSVPTIPTLPGVPITNWDWANRPKESWCPFRYPKYHVDSHPQFLEFMPRQNYMKQRASDIASLTASVRILCAYGAFVPEQKHATALSLDAFNMRIQKQSQVIEYWSKIRFCGANDGIVPMRAAQIPGARFSVLLPSDPKGRIHSTLKTGGVDHHSPAGTDSSNTFWSPWFRNEQTQDYVSVLEGTRALLQADPHELSIAKGGTQKLTVDAGTALANKLYWVFGSVTGTSPGVNLLGIHIPLNPDPYTEVVMGASNSLLFAGFRGTLDANGRATATLRVPGSLSIPPGFAVHHACLVFDASRLHVASNAAPLRMQ